MIAPLPVPVLIAPDLSPGAKLCYAVLCRYAGKDGVCYPSLRTLSDNLNASSVIPAGP
ncbi:MAG: helix-turn-helix domain-containing protein [Acidobacteria bacterium]|nr:helix-turn-helix domain-containing protein [Acidobacteriota bacterium]